MEIENIATGVYSPITGFMGDDDLKSVLHSMRLKNGILWPIPILLDINEKDSLKIKIGERIGLKNESGAIFSILDVTEKFYLDKKTMIEYMYNLDDSSHPGIKQINNMKPICLAGDIELLDSHHHEFDKYRLTPKQIRKCFDEFGWSQIAGFHTRNIPHRGHEKIIRSVIENGTCDGVLIQPVLGEKKIGDFKNNHIMNCYEILKSFDYFRNSVLLTGLSTFSRYAGTREAIFTALIRKNYGCSHFIMGRDHTGVGNTEELNSSKEIFNDIPDLGIKIIKFDEVVYLKEHNKYYFRDNIGKNDKIMSKKISGTIIRQYFQKYKRPPRWLMNQNISGYIMDCIDRGEELFTT